MDISELLQHAINNSASDIHLSANQPPLIRIDGDIQRLEYPQLIHQDILDLLQTIMTPEQQANYAKSSDLDFAYMLPGISRFRVNAFHHHRGAAAALRVIPEKIPSMDALGMGQVFMDLATKPRGLILITGPTGSGKSTSLAAILDFINTNSKQHILTIEDPIEFIHESKNCLISQREIGRDAQDFNSALKSALRADPDIILISELRDRETISLALTAAETGHLVFATLHTASAAKAIDRIIGVFPGNEKSMIRNILSESLQVVVSQVLIKKPGGGRIAAHEILIATTAIRNLIRESKIAQINATIQMGKNIGMQTLDQCLQELINQGKIDLQTAQKKAVVPDSLTAAQNLP